MIEAPPRVIDLRFAPSPYKGLIPYAEDDYAFFFGRDQEQQVISASLMASRLTLMYGASGVGKSSVLRAGVVHRLRERSKRNLAERGNPQFVVVEFSSWRDDPLVGLTVAIESSVRLVMGDRTPPPPPPHHSRELRGVLTWWTDQLRASLLVILDQFEEYFLYHGREEGAGTFDAEFPTAFEQPTLAANFLVSIREDAYTLLDRFEGRIPHLRDRNLRVNHLSWKDARAAIEKPIQRFNELVVPAGEPPYSIEPDLVLEVLKEVKAGQVEAGHPGDVMDVEDADGDRVEAPYLQLVMSRLWDEERKAGSRTLRRSTLSALGGAKEIVRTHLDATMATLPEEDQTAAARTLRFLVTPSGSKVALSVDALADFTQLPESRLVPLLERLSGSGLRILRPVDPPPGEPQVKRYEIFHDVLASAIRDWRARFEARAREADQVRQLEEQKHEAEQRARTARRRLIRVSAVALVAVIFAVASLLVGVWAVHQKNVASQQRGQAIEQQANAQRQRNQAQQQERVARAESLASRAIDRLDVDPQESLALALQAVATNDIPAAETALRRSLSQTRLRMVLPGHTGTVWSASYNQDGTRVVTGSSDKTAKVWDPATGQVVATLSGHTDVVKFAVFDPADDDIVLTVSWDGTARLWSVSGQAELRQVGGSDDYIYGAAFSPDGKTVVTGGLGRVRLWSAATGEQLLTYPTSLKYWVQTVAFSEDGSRVAAGGAGGEVRIWNVDGGTPLKLDLGKQEVATVETLAFSPDGTFLAGGNQNGQTAIWRVAGGQLVRKWTQYSEQVNTVRFSPDSTLLATAAGKVADVWEASSGRFVARMEGKATWVDEAEFSPDSTLVITANQDGTARISDAQSGGELMVLRGHKDIVWTAVFSSDGTRVLTASEDGTARLWDVRVVPDPANAPGQAMDPRAFRGHTGSVTSATFSPDGTQIATSSTDWNAALWDASGTKDPRFLYGDFDVVWSAAFNHDGSVLATASKDSYVQLYDTADGKLRAEAPCCSDPNDSFRPVLSATFNAAGDRLLVVYDDQTAWIWNPSTGDKVQVGGADLTDVLSAAFSPDGTMVATADRTGKTVRIWDATTGEESGDPLTGSAGLTNRVVWYEGSILTSGTDGVVRLWDPASRAEVKEFKSITGGLAAVALSPDGHWVAWGGASGTVVVWSVDTAQVVGIFHPHAADVNSIEFSPDGQWILTASDDATAEMFQCTTCRPISDIEDAACQQLAVEGVPAEVQSYCSSRG
jgi:WD40 repeat protein